MNKVFTIGLSLLILSSCQNEKIVDIEKATKEILALHRAQRDHHFNKDSVAFVGQLSHDFISVNRGVISYPSKTETQRRYHSYFSSVDFNKWDDLQDPIIRFSEDGTLAYTIVDKIVEVKYNEDSVGATHFAWIAIYRKGESGWKIESVASTNE